MQKIFMHTFDYELYLKKSGSVQKCMLEPTEKLMEAFSQVGGRATFFVDTLFLQLLQKENPQEYQRVAKQLIQLVEREHRVELHLHPSWLAAEKLNDNEWMIQDFSRYSLFHFTQDEVNDFFESGISLIKEILRPVDSDYMVTAFRAGGWSVGDGQSVIKAMKKYNIRIESSVAPGMFRPKNNVQYFDFRRSPKNRAHWFFKEHPSLPNEEGELVEIPITTFKIWPYKAVIRKFKKRSWHKQRGMDVNVYGDGQGMSISDILSSKQRLGENINKFLLPKFIMYTLQDVIPGELEKAKSKTINTISHPKNISTTSIEEIHSLAEKGLKSITLLDYYNSIVRK